MLVIFRTLIGVLLALGAATHARAASEFQYTVPAGWRDLMASDAERGMAGIPDDMLAEAKSGRFKAYAADPVETARYPAIFNAVEQPGTVVVTLDEVNKAAAEMIESFGAKGIRMSLYEYSVFKLNGVPVGTMTLTLEAGANSRMIRQYIVPGRKTASVLSYSIPKYEYPRYLPAIEASARATRGAYDNGGYSFKRGATAFFVVGGASALAYVMLTLLRRRRDLAARAEAGGDDGLAAPAPASAARKTSKYVWNCPGCGNPVPMRLEQCRCGTAKPA